jgi:hypothetical protein
VRRIRGVLTRARAVAAGTDPDRAGFFEEKAAVFDAIADTGAPDLAGVAFELAERARTAATDLRTEAER